MTNENNEDKEEFCSACVAAPLSAATVGVLNNNDDDNENPNNNDNQALIILFMGILISFISIGWCVWKLKFCNDGCSA